MGRPEPCILFSQTFVHNQLDEYVDEVTFADPIVITACEFLEQNASSTSPAVTLMGATSPPSFALEVFVQSEGEARFRRLCQPFLYSHSSSNVLEVEAVVTNYLVVRGSYRSLSLVIYGNTAEDLGQFNIEVDLDSSLTKTVSVVEGSLEDLPFALQRTNPTDKIICPLKALSIDLVAPDISVEIKHFLHLTFKILELTNPGDAIKTAVNAVVSAASNHATHSLHYLINSNNKYPESRFEKSVRCNCDFTETRKELMCVYNCAEYVSGNATPEFLQGTGLSEFEAEPVSTKQLMDMFSEYFKISISTGVRGHPQLSEKKNIMLWASLALFFCLAKESCFHFVNGGGLKQLELLFSHGQKSNAVTLMLLGVAEQATRHSVGCEGLLGWWPRDDENVPSGFSEGYNQLLKLLLQKQRHDVASLSTFVLQRLRCYEVASRYEYAVLSVLGLSSSGKATTVTLDMLSSAKLQLKKLAKLIDCHGPIEDPSPVARAGRSLLLGEDENLLSYKATSRLVTASKCCSSKRDMDPHLLLLLKERGFLPLSAALLASSILRSKVGLPKELVLDITTYIEAIVISLLYCRSGLLFLLHDPEVATTVILALKGVDSKKEYSIPLRYASFLISKGFFCPPHEVGTIVETHLRIVNAIDSLIASKPQSEELLWSLWELCCLSRSSCGRMALLAVGHFPEAVGVLMAALHSVKEYDTLSMTTGTSPLNLAIFHSAVEIFEVIVTDSSPASLGSWIEHAKELHRALHSSSPGSSRKDAPTRLLEWIDASVVYHRTGASGLLRYAAVLASGGDGHIAASSILASDAMDVDTVVGDISSSADGNLIDNLLGKSISETKFLGVTLRDSSVAQLTTAFRILALISDNSAVAIALYDECATTVIHAILIDCSLMLERSSNNYDYLVDEGTECNSTADLLLERNRQQGLVDLLIPCLVLLINLLKRLEEAKEQHRNTKLLKALLHLHREVSPKLAACSTDLFYPYPEIALGFETVCHLLASSLACWPLYGWTPGLFHFLLDSLHATSILALGPKETCSTFSLLNDLLPDEGVWLWKSGMPISSALRTLAVGTSFGTLKAQETDWYLHDGNPEKMLSQLTRPLLDKIAQIIIHYSTSTSVAIQDLLRVFIIRITCISPVKASVLLQPLILWIHDHLSDLSSLSDVDAWKVYRSLSFFAILLEHPRAKPIMTDGVQMLSQVLEICIDVTDLDATQYLGDKNFPFLLSWCVPVFRSISLISDPTTPVQYPGMYDRYKLKTLTAEDCSKLLFYCLKLCKVLPVGRELVACLLAFKAISSSAEGRSAFQSIYLCVRSSGDQELKSEAKHGGDGKFFTIDAPKWKKHPPLLHCWLTLLRSISSGNLPQVHAVEALAALSLGVLRFVLDGKSLNMERVATVKFLFGISSGGTEEDDFSGDNIKYVQELISLLALKISDPEYSAPSGMSKTLHEVKESAESLLLLLQISPDSDQQNYFISRARSLLSFGVRSSSKIHMLKDCSSERVEDFSLPGFGDKFLWECPENLRDGMSQTALSAKRKMSSLEGVSRRPRDQSPAETLAQNSYSRGSGAANSSVPSRRDNFRLRKPNTSRPPSMHVDDYVARERNVDGTTSSNVITVSRVGPTGGRPPSIHVDEFMARQRERQNPVGMTSNEAAQVKAANPEKEADAEVGKSKQVKPDLDDDLQGIDIVFDGEESDSDDKLPFPQPDDNLQQPSSVIVEQNSPHSVVAETESDINDSQFSGMSTPIASNFDENTWNDFSSRSAKSQQNMSLTREGSVSTDKKYIRQSEDAKNFAATTSSGFGSMYGRNSRPSAQVESRMPRPGYYSKNNPQAVVSSQGYYDQKFQLNQPPLPPMPPPPTVSPAQSAEAAQIQPAPFVSAVADMQPSLPPGFHVRAEYASPGGSSRAQPPLPPTPPPYSVNISNFQSFKPSSSQPHYNQSSGGSTDFQHTNVIPSSDTRLNSLPVSGATMNSYAPLIQHLIFSRPNSVPVSVYGSSSSSHPGDNPSSISQNFPIALSTMPSIQSVSQLQPLQPPQLLRPPHPPQHIRPPISASPQAEQSLSLLQSPGQVQLQPLQILQPPQVSPANGYYSSMQQDSIQHTTQQQRGQNNQPQFQHQQGHGTQQTSDDIGSLQHYFSSAEALQSLLSDREKLCTLLVQHPKLMQLLQEKLGHL
ncbi:hypothetical protein ACET3Z_023421 [Daucus carota]